MKDLLKKAYVFLAVSSADPKKTSLSVKMALLGIVPMVLQGLDLVCEFGKQCINVGASELESVVQLIADTTFYGLTIFATLGFLYGTLRKLWLTVRGDNRALGALKK